jgi:transposase
MTVNHTTAATVLVAIDISKHRHEVLIGVPDKKRRRRMTVMNTLEDFQRLSASLASYELPVRIGFEATGNYHRPLAHHLGEAGFELKLISSVGLARTRLSFTSRPASLSRAAMRR